MGEKREFGVVGTLLLLFAVVGGGEMIERGELQDEGTELHVLFVLFALERDDLLSVDILHA